MPKYKKVNEGIIDNFITKIFTSVGKGLESRAIKKLSKSDPELARQFKDLQKTKKRLLMGYQKMNLKNSLIISLIKFFDRMHDVQN